MTEAARPPVPIRRKALPTDAGLLARRGFEALPPAQARAEAVVRHVSAIGELYAHPLRRLADQRGGTVFAEFEDEMLPFRRDGVILDLFATAPPGQALFLGREDGRVYQHNEWTPDASGPCFERINTDLERFVRCRCRELSIALRIPSLPLPSAETEAWIARAEADEAEMRAFLVEADPPALDSRYWQTVVYEFSEGFHQLGPGLSHFIELGRLEV